MWKVGVAGFGAAEVDVSGPVPRERLVGAEGVVPGPVARRPPGCRVAIDATLDRIDKIVEPGADINPADNYDAVVPAIAETQLRRRPEAGAITAAPCTYQNAPRRVLLRGGTGAWFGGEHPRSAAGRPPTRSSNLTQYLQRINDSRHLEHVDPEAAAVAGGTTVVDGKRVRRRALGPVGAGNGRNILRCSDPFPSVPQTYQL